MSMYQKPVTLADIVALAAEVWSVTRAAEKVAGQIGRNIADETLPAADGQYAFRRHRQAAVTMLTPKLAALSHAIAEWGRG
jgi:hypothetical protein